ncbi:MAG: hypothetical protein ACRDRZ_12030 [Pseudonocardiaceae bacterium]
MSSEVAAERDPLTALPSDPGPGQQGRGKPGKRVRIVLAERRSTRRVVRTLAEVEEQTGVGEEMFRQFKRSQLNLALGLGGLAAAVLGAIPLAFAFVPALGTISIFGIRLPWLLLGFMVYPFLLAVGWAYLRSAERNEQDFTVMAES